MKMQYFIILIVVGIVWCTNYHLRRNIKCTKSYDCTSTAPCCRDAHNRTLTNQDHLVPRLDRSNGTCSSVLGKKDDFCDSSCGCKTGYKCYRPMAGIELPTRCYNATWVEQQQHYWANCHPPTCYYPP
ncbi:uncharacterized protein LOC127714987 isoform X2 [Mytilus californianus]|uniref:uncharacterized protein LOC127714987 isoform X2 n=1 Tax=Mytilus californianus TaxID=6549 RepID=UPI002245A9B0|nr:uncharacterized protein LOC127714987 isoform X2 [Mytilus californianus]